MGLLLHEWPLFGLEVSPLPPSLTWQILLCSPRPSFSLFTSLLSLSPVEALNDGDETFEENKRRRRRSGKLRGGNTDWGEGRGESSGERESPACSNALLRRLKEKRKEGELPWGRRKGKTGLFYQLYCFKSFLQNFLCFWHSFLFCLARFSQINECENPWPSFTFFHLPRPPPQCTQTSFYTPPARGGGGPVLTLCYY